MIGPETGSTSESASFQLRHFLTRHRRHIINRTSVTSPGMCDRLPWTWPDRRRARRLWNIKQVTARRLRSRRNLRRNHGSKLPRGKKIPQILAFYFRFPVEAFICVACNDPKWEDCYGGGGINYPLGNVFVSRPTFPPSSVTYCRPTYLTAKR